MRLIVGLGNPGEKYKETRHNVGFMAINEIISKLKTKNSKLIQFCLDTQFKAEIAQSGDLGKEQILFAKPVTFMNNSGQAVRKIMDYFKINPEDLIVISDDVNLEIGEIRIRKSGSSGGHNGLESIINHIKGDNFTRIRVGIGMAKEEKMVLEDHVLQKFPPREKEEIKKAIDKVAELVISSLSLGEIKEETINIAVSSKD